ncbi:HotDog domain-containing protein [Parasitella parasitica]|nr:HotDog domain-containing protein [Parasitella parasitica]
MLRSIVHLRACSRRATLSASQRARLATSSRQIRGAQPSLIEADHDFSRFQNFTKKVYTARPIAFWMDKILEKESKKPLDLQTSQHEHVTVSKTMSDSYMEEYLPFKSSPALLDEYITTGGKIRIGKILEDLDALAAAISYKHIDTFAAGPPMTAVTASVDRMELLMPNTVQDFKLSGHVAHVGKSSMEVFVKLETMSVYNPKILEASAFPPRDFIAEPTSNTVLFARFTMVAINSATGKSVRVNPLVTRTDKEKKICEYAQDCKSRKRLVGESALSKAPPTEDERLTLHNIYMNYSKENKTTAPENTVWMEDTKLQSVFLMQPQDRNIQNKVFGGYLMRRAYELAHATGSVYAKCPVKLLSLDEIIFKKPVPVGSLLNLSSQVIYAQGDPHKSFQVSVAAEVTDIETGATDLTNTFHFTLAAQDKPVPKILPRTYAESILYLEGKRKREEGVQAKEQLLNLMSNNDDQH